MTTTPGKGTAWRRTRRRVLLAGGGWVAGMLLAACTVPEPGGPPRNGDGAGELTARPPTERPDPPPAPPAAGNHQLGLVADRDPVLHVPPGLVPGQPAPLLLALHGAGGSAGSGLALLSTLADEHGVLVMAPASRGSTWDAIRGRYGRDRGLIDRALQAVFATVPVDPDRIGIAGFSDGASYALGLGLANGRLFRRILAFSPGFVPPGGRSGRPRVFVSHGDADDVLPIRATSRRIVPALEDDGYDVTYREFPGGHTVPPDIARDAVDWLGWSHPG